MNPATIGPNPYYSPILYNHQHTYPETPFYPPYYPEHQSNSYYTPRHHCTSPIQISVSPVVSESSKPWKLFEERDQMRRIVEQKLELSFYPLDWCVNFECFQEILLQRYPELADDLSSPSSSPFENEIEGTVLQTPALPQPSLNSPPLTIKSNLDMADDSKVDEVEIFTDEETILPSPVMIGLTSLENQESDKKDMLQGGEEETENAIAESPSLTSGVSSLKPLHFCKSKNLCEPPFVLPAPPPKHPLPIQHATTIIRTRKTIQNVVGHQGLSHTQKMFDLLPDSNGCHPIQLSHYDSPSHYFPLNFPPPRPPSQPPDTFSTHKDLLTLPPKPTTIVALHKLRSPLFSMPSGSSSSSAIFMEAAMSHNFSSSPLLSEERKDSKYMDKISRVWESPELSQSPKNSASPHNYPTSLEDIYLPIASWSKWKRGWNLYCHDLGGKLHCNSLDISMLIENSFVDDCLRRMRDISPCCHVVLFFVTFTGTMMKFVTKRVKDYDQRSVEKEELSLVDVKQFKVHFPNELSKILMIEDKTLRHKIIFVWSRIFFGMWHEVTIEFGNENTTTQGVFRQDNRGWIIKVYKDGLTQVLLSCYAELTYRKQVQYWSSAIRFWVLVSSNRSYKCGAEICLLGVTCEECQYDCLLPSYFVCFHMLLSTIQPPILKLASCPAMSYLFPRSGTFSSMKRDGAFEDAILESGILKMAKWLIKWTKYSIKDLTGKRQLTCRLVFSSFKLEDTLTFGEGWHDRTHFVGRGERIEDLEPFYPDRMVGRILGMGDVLSFVEKAQEVMSQENAEDLQKKIRSAKFDFNDFLKQTRMGSPAQIREAENTKAACALVYFNPFLQRRVDVLEAWTQLTQAPSWSWWLILKASLFKGFYEDMHQWCKLGNVFYSPSLRTSLISRGQE